jgi:hypothetical protein
MQTQTSAHRPTRAEIAGGLIVIAAIIAVFAWLIMGLVQATQCSSAQYQWTHALLPVDHRVVTTVDGGIPSESVVSVPTSDSLGKHLEDQALADWQAAGCQGNINTWRPF